MTTIEPLFPTESHILDSNAKLEPSTFVQLILDGAKLDTATINQVFSDVDDSSFDPSGSSSYSSEDIMDEEPVFNSIDSVASSKEIEEENVINVVEPNIPTEEPVYTIFDMTPDPEYQPKSQGQHMNLIVGPAEHQIKDFLIVPNNVLSMNGTPKEGDYIVVKLICDKAVCSQREIFLTAVSPKYSRNADNETEIPNLKITKYMTPGKTKGFKFAFTYTLYSEDKPVERLVSTPFHLWSNVKQKGFPRSSRDHLIVQRTKQNANKRRRLM
uniref:Uncharacterized protein n=1 Tax=Clandestinovirus TaxID=2831644 RepID=A0A8F8PKB3_9VIRU|nr:hypothetical protein KOM_12_565 [Clandestinovirus]